MERTQIYLEGAQTAALDRLARERGTTRSHLIREALEQYLTPAWDPEAFKAALHGVAGLWADRDDLDELYASLRQAEREKLEGLFPDLAVTDGDVPDHR